MRKCATKEHPNLAKLIDYQIQEDMIYLVLELCDGGNLRDLMKKKKFSEHEALQIFHQIVLGLWELHEELNITHRDIKPENILIHKLILKLSDFSLSVEKEYFSSNAGTLIYMAPEYFDEVSKEKSVDIWALGIILYELIFGVHPFWQNQGIGKLLLSICSGQFEIPVGAKISEECLDLLKRCLDKNPKKRINIKEIKNHPCFDVLKKNHPCFDVLNTQSL